MRYYSMHKFGVDYVVNGLTAAHNLCVLGYPIYFVTQPLIFERGFTVKNGLESADGL